MATEKAIELPIADDKSMTVIKKGIGYKIIGNDLQIVDVYLQPGQSVIAEAGALNHMTSGISFETRIGDGSKKNQGVLGKIVSAGARMMSGESLFVTHFENISDTQQSVAFAAPYTGTIVPIDLGAVGNEIICQKDAFIAAALGTKITITFTKRIDAGFFGGEGFILQKLVGDSVAFVHAGGIVIEKDLNDETLIIDTGSVVAFTKNLDYDIKLVKSMKSMLFGKEGLFLSTLKGTGKVWIQSLPFNRFVGNIVRHLPASIVDKKAG